MTDQVCEGQTRWEFPKQCYICDRSVEGKRVTLTYPVIPEHTVNGVPFSKGPVFVFCVDCGADIMKEIIMTIACRKGATDGDHF